MKKKMFHPDIAMSLPCWLSQFSFSKLRQPRRDITTSGRNKKKIGPILFLYYEESLVSSNLNSKLFRFHCVGPNIGAQKRFQSELAPILKALNCFSLTVKIGMRGFPHYALRKSIIWHEF